jgi:hypothetical protein
MEPLITQREAADRITNAWGIPMHESKLSVLVSVGAGPVASGKRGTATVYAVHDVDNWAAEELRKSINDLESKAAEYHAILAKHGYV